MRTKINHKIRRFTNLGTWFIALAITFIFMANADAEGFRITPPGTFDLGRAGGRIAQVDDSSAVGQNPANLTDLTNAEIQATPGVIYFKANFNSSAAPGQSAETIDHWNFIPNAFAAIPLYDGKFAFGLGVSAPYGLGVHWDQNSSAFAPFTGVLRYTTPYSVDLETLNINPSMAIKLGDKLRIGAGLDVMWSEIELKQFYPWFLVVPGNPDGHLHSDADGFGAGANLAITWQITEHQRFAITYRSPIKINYDGNFSADNNPLAGGGTSHSSFGTSLKFPTIVAVGYGVDLPHNVRLESDFEWLQFSNFKNLPINIGNNAANPPDLPTSVPENWHNSFTIGIGGDWQFADNWVLRAGYQFYDSPIPDQSLTPSIPDANENVFTVGLGYKHGHHSLEAAYGFDLYDTRNINNPPGTPNAPFNGKYGVTAHLFSFAYRYSF
ncbi:MAG: outer membrane protein transport protein [Verrucomicrobiota bacterium]|jgi:long-chain fatty acid transport protein